MLRRSASQLVLTIVPLAGAVSMAGSTDQRPAAAATQSATVSMKDNLFWPAEVVVAAGTTVTWVNDEWTTYETHDVNAMNGSFYSDVFGAGGSFSVTFWETGAYGYYCSLHEGMYGTVYVE